MKNKLTIILIITCFSFFILNCGSDNKSNDKDKTTSTDQPNVQQTNMTDQKNPDEKTTDGWASVISGIKPDANVARAAAAVKEEDLSEEAKKARAHVLKGVDYIKSAGKEKAFQAFNDRNGQFVDGEYYLFTYDKNGTIVSHGGNEQLIGKNFLDISDPDGIFFAKEFLKVARDYKEGWVDYKWSNPNTQKIEQKSSYIIYVPEHEIILGCGFYKK